MFGNNAVTAPSYRSDGVLRVKEVFYTLQGEGPRAGQPAVFVRLAGCNLRCHFCDTDFEGGELLDVQAIIAKVVEAAPGGCELVVLTGGEPLAQQVLPLVAALTCMTFTTQVETAGTCVPPDVGDLTFERLVSSGCLEVVCSPKTPKIHMTIRQLCKAYKYVVRAGQMAQDDGLPSHSTQLPGRLQRVARPPVTMPIVVYLQPVQEYALRANAVETGTEMDVDNAGTKRNLEAAVQACMKHGYRLSLQLHKLLGLP